MLLAKQNWNKGMWWLKYNFCIVNKALLTPDNHWLCFECGISLLKPAVRWIANIEYTTLDCGYNSELCNETGESGMRVRDEISVRALESKRSPYGSLLSHSHQYTCSSSPLCWQKAGLAAVKIKYNIFICLYGCACLKDKTSQPKQNQWPFRFFTQLFEGTGQNLNILIRKLWSSG